MKWKNEAKAIGAYLVLFLAVTLLLGGCSFVSVNTRPYLGVPTYPPTDPATVEILRTEPQQSCIQLGEIALEPTGNPPVTKIEQKLREAAAKMGANAAVLVVDRTMMMGTVVSGPWWGRQISPDYQRVIVAVAVRCTN